MDVYTGGMHGAVLEGPDKLEPGAIPDVGQARVRVRSKGPLVDSPLPGAVENGAPALELQDAVRRFLGVNLGHPPVVDELAAFHRVGEMHLPRVLVGDVVHGSGHAALGHDRVRLAQERLADDHHARAGLSRRDGSAQPRSSRSEDEDVGLDRLVGGGRHRTHRGSCSTPASRRRM